MDKDVLKVLLEPIQPTATKYLQYGAIIQLKPLLPTSASKVEDSTCLSITPSVFRGLTNTDIINERSAVTLATSKYPCKRNTFKLVHPKQEETEGEPIKYNDDFLLQSCCPRNNQIDSPHPVIYSCNRIIENPSLDVDNYYYNKGSLQQPIALAEYSKELTSAVSSISCRWRFIHADPEYRYEHEGQPINTRDPVLILHSASNKYLTPESDPLRQKFTLLGMETCVSVRYRCSKSRDQLGMWRI